MICGAVSLLICSVTQMINGAIYLLFCSVSVGDVMKLISQLVLFNWLTGNKDRELGRVGRKMEILNNCSYLTYRYGTLIVTTTWGGATTR